MDRNCEIDSGCKNWASIRANADFTCKRTTLAHFKAQLQPSFASDQGASTIECHS
jgi:hypothetical protein